MKVTSIKRVESVTLELSVREAKMLLALVGRIGGYGSGYENTLTFNWGRDGRIEPFTATEMRDELTNPLYCDLNLLTNEDSSD